ncbi:transposase [Paenibacillus sp. sptzw28]|uniref:transposase n=1 Tax=Paenibacillus sp. sptzw28 TaxID=715179 RepID=UPI001C6E085B|nr:transposase [Paenibacillus sp. sptzw28]QYR21696.1 transposase [Paenibacillus sp. sptzw28]
MRGSLAEQKKATIYQYQLVRKIPVRKELLWSHYVIAFILIVFQIAMYQFDGFIAIVLGISCTQLVHFIIIRLTLLRVDIPDSRRWGWRLTPPWVGYIPIAHIELSVYRRLHRHLLWLGLATVCIVYPWANEAQMISLISWHLWFLIPRIVILRRLRKFSRDGILKIQSKEINCYHR